MENYKQIVDVLDVVCPMHVILDDSGHIQHVGPTLQKLRSDAPFPSQRFLEVFELSRPRAVTSMEGLLKCAGIKMHLKLRDSPRTSLKGVLVPISGGAILNLSFGISILDGVRDYALTSADFAATDLTIEMLYLVEAKSAAMQASRKLNTRLQSAMIAAEEQAFTDTLTGLKNRRAMDHILGRLLESKQEFALMHLDLDFFKAVNDTKGHAAGDHVLQKVARIMLEETRENDTVARVGGDEFVLLISDLVDRKKLESIATRLIKKLEVPIPFQKEVCNISASIGIVLSPDYSIPTAEQLMADADTALYASKHKGRACHTFFEGSLRENDAFQTPPVGRETQPSSTTRIQ